MAEPDEKRVVTEHDVEFTRVVEHGRTIRTISVCTVIAIGLICLSISAVTILKPPWETLLVALFGPSGLVFVLYKVHLQYVAKTHHRNTELERGYDERRTSTESPASVAPTPQIDPAVTDTALVIETETITYDTPAREDEQVKLIRSETE